MDSCIPAISHCLTVANARSSPLTADWIAAHTIVKRKRIRFALGVLSAVASGKLSKIRTRAFAYSATLTLNGFCSNHLTELLRLLLIFSRFYLSLNFFPQLCLNCTNALVKIFNSCVMIAGSAISPLASGSYGCSDILGYIILEAASLMFIFVPFQRA